MELGEAVPGSLSPLAVGDDYHGTTFARRMLPEAAGINFHGAPFGSQAIRETPGCPLERPSRRATPLASRAPQQKGP